MDTCGKLSRVCKEEGIYVVGIPKTMDHGSFRSCKEKSERRSSFDLETTPRHMKNGKNSGSTFAIWNRSISHFWMCTVFLR